MAGAYDLAKVAWEQAPLQTATWEWEVKKMWLEGWRLGRAALE